LAERDPVADRDRSTDLHCGFLRHFAADQLDAQLWLLEFPGEAGEQALGVVDGDLVLAQLDTEAAVQHPLAVRHPYSVRVYREQFDFTAAEFLDDLVEQGAEIVSETDRVEGRLWVNELEQWSGTLLRLFIAPCDAHVGYSYHQSHSRRSPPSDVNLARKEPRLWPTA
jgi:hypothetical protein